MPNGILIIDKPAGWTSMDVCAKVRGILHPHQDRKTEQETNHTRNLLFAPAGRGPILPHTRGSFLASW